MTDEQMNVKSFAVIANEASVASEIHSLHRKINRRGFPLDAERARLRLLRERLLAARRGEAL